MDARVCHLLVFQLNSSSVAPVSMRDIRPICILAFVPCVQVLGAFVVVAGVCTAAFPSDKGGSIFAEVRPCF